MVIHGLITTHPFTDKAKVNAAQRQAIATYAGGKYAGLLNMPMDWSDLLIKLENVDDLVFQGLIMHLATAEGCTTVEEAALRVTEMAHQLAKVQTEMIYSVLGEPSEAVVSASDPDYDDQGNLKAGVDHKPELNNPET